ncbi:PTS system sorbose-specific EIIC component [bioreactor metagenome]|uniref:PTS system sorbose-specific EIIC component n=1 Tax=bioreactor metagenome TaxID=1076179 RepID=A0A645C312_9ZZZZ|nr:PTS sugar transporter subunit IIC [Erysipelotrichaceae bacterium]
MGLVQAVLIALMGYLAAECVPWLMGDFGGYYVLSKPLASGLIVGLILGDVKTGIMVGAAVQTVYLASMSVGGAIQTDIAIVAYPAVALGIVAGGDPNVAIALATTLGILGILVWNVMEFLNVFWGDLANKAAEKADYKGVILYHVGGTQVTTFLLRFVPSFIVLYFGASYVAQIQVYAPDWLMNALGVIGGILPAVGISMLTSLLIKDGTYWVYFMIGFIAVVYFNLSLIAIAVIAIIIAIIAYKSLGNTKNNKGDDGKDNDMEAQF